ncbi:MAG: stage III sporulation protein AA [Clostridiales bacterium]|nr:stage III sporulation protein AA [Clostridiales bacterium]
MENVYLPEGKSVIEDVLDMLPVKISDEVKTELLTEVRLRAGRRVQLRYADGGELLSSERLEEKALCAILARMLRHSLYAWENELKEGFFTLEDGCRVGVCGRYAMNGEQIESLIHIGSVCIRAAREIKGCAQKLEEILTGNSGNVLILAPPGMGKTTLLRDAARFMSDSGMNVAVADERSEIAACRNGIPAFDVGERTDVMDNCPKAVAMGQLIRACAPDVLVTDEVGNHLDADAVLDAARCGVKVVASAHAESFETAEKRVVIAQLIQAGAFRHIAVLGNFPGNLKETRTLW